MDMVRLAGVGLAAVLLGGAAWGQARYEKPKPTYEEALTSVTWGGCERADAERYIRFYCPESEALWYFTVEGHAEHETYFIGPVRDASRNGIPIFGEYSGGHAPSREAAMEKMRAHQTWMREIIKIWQEDAGRMQARLKRGPGKLYPLEPQ